MNSEDQNNYTRYFVRRVTKDLISQLVSTGQTSQAGDSTWEYIQDGAAKIGLGILDVLRAALFIKKPDVNVYPKTLKNSAANLRNKTVKLTNETFELIYLFWILFFIDQTPFVLGRRTMIPTIRPITSPITKPKFLNAKLLEMNWKIPMQRF